MFLTLEVEADGQSFILTNFYNANTEPEQILTLKKLLLHIKLLNIDKYSQIVCVKLNFFFNSQLEVDGGNLNFKIKYFFEIREALGLYERVTNTDKKDLRSVQNTFHFSLFTFRSKHFSGLIQRRLGYIFYFKQQESIERTKILGGFLSEHSPVSLKIGISKELRRGAGQ